MLTHPKVIMSQITQSLENSYYKTVSVIESCKTKKQLEGASRMVENFKEIYKQVGYPKVLSYSLERAIYKKYLICQ